MRTPLTAISGYIELMENNIEAEEVNNSKSKIIRREENKQK